MNSPKEYREGALRKSCLHCVLSFPVWIVGRERGVVMRSPLSLYPTESLYYSWLGGCEGTQDPPVALDV